MSHARHMLPNFFGKLQLSFPPIFLGGILQIKSVRPIRVHMCDLQEAFVFFDYFPLPPHLSLSSLFVQVFLKSKP